MLLRLPRSRRGWLFTAAAAVVLVGLVLNDASLWRVLPAALRLLGHLS